MKEKFIKELCVGCKRIVSQWPTKFNAQEPIIAMICLRCTEEIKELLKIIKAHYGFRLSYGVAQKRKKK